MLLERMLNFHLIYSPGSPKEQELASIDARLHRALEAEQQMRREAEVAASFSIIEFYSLACCLKNRRPTGLPHELTREKLAITQGT